MNDPLRLGYLYTSRLAPTAPIGIVATITRRAREHNASFGITGVLMFDGESFAQFIEGPSAEIRALRQRIEGDPRHCEVDLLWFGPAGDEPSFPGWQLGYVDTDVGDDLIGRLRTLRGRAALEVLHGMVPMLDIGVF